MTGEGSVQLDAPPRVAVIIPTHNRAALIGAALDSVIEQTAGGPFEVAVVDDGSTDDTGRVMATYLERFGAPGGNVRVTYTKLEKQGVVAARNTGIANTTAPYVAFLDSDDYWNRRKIELQLRALEADDLVGVAHTSFRYVDEQGNFVDDGPQRVDNPCVGDCLEVLLDEFVIVFSSVLMRRSVIERAAGDASHGLPFDPRWTNAQDYDLMLRAARLCRFAYVAEPLTYYRLHGGHGAMGNLKRAFGFHCRVQMAFAERYGEAHGLSMEAAKRRAANFLFGRAEAQFWQRRLTVARDLCDLAAELGVSDNRFAALRKRASIPRWVYRAKDAMDRLFKVV